MLINVLQKAEVFGVPLDHKVGRAALRQRRVRFLRRCVVVDLIVKESSSTPQNNLGEGETSKRGDN